MVKVREAIPIAGMDEADVDSWVETLPGFEQANDQARIKEACQMAMAAQKKARAQGSPKFIECFDAGLEMARILADLHMDEDSLVAAVIYRSVREQHIEMHEVRAKLGQVVATLVSGVLKMAAISDLRTDSVPVLGQGNAQVENLRKMLVAMIDDVRVALIKLAERTQAIRAVKNHPNPEKQIRVAREVFEVYAPLAHRLGIGQIKWELEDLSFRYLEPDAYKAIANLLDGKRLSRQTYIDNVVELLRNSLLDAGVEAEVSGRAKHIYSIWRKMQRKNVDFDQVYDIRALRVMVPELRDCYASLGVVHTLWRNIPREFDDYIANPKDNGYRSLHTAVIGPEGKVLEVQIRTHDMHEEAELGVCAHWLYKGTDNGAASQGYESKIGWLRQVLEWHEETSGDSQRDSSELANDLAHDFSRDRIYVFTPEGHVVDIAVGSTPVDFAYHIHTEVGHRCRGAKVDGRIVPLSTALRNGQKVEILKGSEEAPNRDWLRAGLGYIHSTRARSKVRAWFRKQAREKNVAAGRDMLEKEIKRLAFTSIDYKLLAGKLCFATVDDLYAALGSGDIATSKIVAAAQELISQDTQIADFPSLVSPRRRKNHTDNAIAVVGARNFLTQIAGCCKPLPGDDIAGYVTVNRGVSVHRKDCRHFLQLDSSQSERIIEVEWGEENAEAYAVDIDIEAYDRTGLLSDISGLLAVMKVNVLSINSRSSDSSSVVKLSLSVEIRGIEELARLLARLNNLPNVISAEREI